MKIIVSIKHKYLPPSTNISKKKKKLTKNKTCDFFPNFLLAVKAFELFSKNENMKDRRMAEITYKTGLCYYAVMNHDKAIEEFEKAVNFIQKEIDTRSEVAQTAEAIKVVKEFCELRGEIQQKIADVQETKEMVWHLSLEKH